MINIKDLVIAFFGDAAHQVRVLRSVRVVRLGDVSGQRRSKVRADYV